MLGSAQRARASVLTAVSSLTERGVDTRVSASIVRLRATSARGARRLLGER